MGTALCSEHSYVSKEIDYVHPGLRYFSKDEILRLKKIDTTRLLMKKKLHLVLDLDQTLIQSKQIESSSWRAEYLKNKQAGSNVFRLDIVDDCYMIKLRPFVQMFLEEASNLFEMYICTMGTRSYAKKVVKFLDPESKYFGSRIITREYFNQMEKKNLDLVFAEERNIVVLDDTVSVWGDYAENLIHVSKYNYFRDGEDEEGEGDESWSDGALANILRILRAVHALYFGNPAIGDVRSYMTIIRGWILRGCCLYFSVDLKEFPLSWSRAEEMGALCTTEMDSLVTHVISKDNIKDGSLAEQEEKFLVHPRWIDAAYFLWRKQSEGDYMIRSHDL